MVLISSCSARVVPAMPLPKSSSVSVKIYLFSRQIKVIYNVQKLVSYPFLEPAYSTESEKQRRRRAKPTARGNQLCTAHYKPNIWSYDRLRSLVRDYEIPGFIAQVEKLKEDFVLVYGQEMDTSKKVQIVDSICKLGLSNIFKHEIFELFDAIESELKLNPSFTNNVGSGALRFRLLRQHGHNASKELITDFLNEEGAVKSNTSANILEIIELYEACHVALEDESLLKKAKVVSYENLEGIGHLNSLDQNLIASRAMDISGIPQHWRAQWFQVRQQIDAYEMDSERNIVLLELAKVNFNMVQAVHRRDLQHLSAWWTSLGLVKKVSFARDRLVESFVFAVGIAPEPHYVCARKWVTKVVTLMLVMDDIYDLYGSLDELECFTQAVDRWDQKETSQLPECMKICLSALFDTTYEIATEIQMENGFPGGLPYLRKAWADFCKSMLTEARWLKKGYTPSLEEYLNNAWISSCGSLLSLAVVFVSPGMELLTVEKLRGEMQDLIYYTSLIVRLCNDLATAAAEHERGDSSSILCYMREARVTEEAAKLKIKEMIGHIWYKINEELLKHSPMHLSMVTFIMNAARVAHCFYHTGDGFGVQDGHIKTQIKRMLIEPLE